MPWSLPWGDRDPLPYIKPHWLWKRELIWKTTVNSYKYTIERNAIWHHSYVYIYIRIHLDYGIINSLQNTRSAIFAGKKYVHQAFTISKTTLAARLFRRCMLGANFFSFSRNRPSRLLVCIWKEFAQSTPFIDVRGNSYTFLYSDTSTRTNITSPGVVEQYHLAETMVL